MPRLVSSSLDTPYRGQIVEVSPSSKERREAGAGARSTIMCLSRTGRSLHCLTFIDREAYIETHSLPLPGSTEEESVAGSGETTSTVVRTKLPEGVQAALHRYPALELLCLDSPSSNSMDSRGMTGSKENSLVCLYTRRDSFVVELTYAPTGHHEVEGEITFVREPFESMLLGASSTSIVRIRPAPQRRLGFATMCPPGCMAMLCHDSVTNEYNLVLHQEDSSLSTPLAYGMEQLDDKLERITDFCFCQSSALPLLSSMTILLLKGSGDVMMASPILFRGSVVPKVSVARALDFLETELGDLDASGARRRQYRSAKQFLLDVFPDSGRSEYTTAQVRSEASVWPVQMQGPVLLAGEDDDPQDMASTIIEPVPSGELPAVAIIKGGSLVDFGLLSPTLMIPRFRHESEDDSAQLDNDLKWGPIVQRVDLSSDKIDHLSINALIPDPVMDNVVHLVTPTSIRSVATNILKVTANKIRGKPEGKSSTMMSPSHGSESPKTSVWSCVESPSGIEGVSIVGAVVSGEAHLGHVLICRLSDGSMVPVNLTETRHFHELEAIVSADESFKTSKTLTAAEKALQATEDSQPLYSLIEPVLQKVSVGLASMGKIVGSSTPTKDITPDQLAVALSVKERCDNEIVLPLWELAEIVAARRKVLESSLKNQLAQLETLRANATSLENQMASIVEKTELVHKNATSLSARSSSILQTCHDLRPTLSLAESNYFQELRRLDAKTKEWAENYKLLSDRVGILYGSMKEGRTFQTARLTSDYEANCRKVLRGSEDKRHEQKDRLDSARNDLREIEVELKRE